MSEASFTTTNLDLQDTPPPMSLLEIHLRDLLHKIRQQARTALCIERAIEVPGLIGKQTPLAIQFDTSNEAELPEAYITHINPANGGRLFFMIPKVWTGIAPSGNLTIQTAVKLLESFYRTMINPEALMLYFGQQIASGTNTDARNDDLTKGDDPTLPAQTQTSRPS